VLSRPPARCSAATKAASKKTFFRTCIKNVGGGKQRVSEEEWGDMTYVEYFGVFPAVYKQDHVISFVFVRGCIAPRGSNSFGLK